MLWLCFRLSQPHTKTRSLFLSFSLNVPLSVSTPLSRTLDQRNIRPRPEILNRKELYGYSVVQNNPRLAEAKWTYTNAA